MQEVTAEMARLSHDKGRMTKETTTKEIAKVRSSCLNVKLTADPKSLR